jgi:transposase
MRKIHLVLRLFFAAGLSIRAIARSIHASPSTVGDYIRRAQVAGLSWPLPEGMDERAVEAKLFPPRPPASPIVRPLPEWAKVHRELRRKGVTLSLLWYEYKAEHPDGVQYSWFCERYRAWAQHIDVVMRQEHRAGEKLFVDYAGQSVPVINRETGELREAQIFVAVLGASNYTFAEASWTQSLPDWCASHVRALNFLGGAPELAVPDYVPGNIIGLRRRRHAAVASGVAGLLGARARCGGDHAQRRACGAASGRLGAVPLALRDRSVAASAHAACEPRLPRSHVGAVRYVGSALTLQTALGFALTLITIQLVPALLDILGWHAVFVVLAIGPAFGALSMWRLRGLPEAIAMASGRR